MTVRKRTKASRKGRQARRGLDVFVFFGLALSILAFHWGCQSGVSPTSPMVPSKAYNFSVSIPVTKSLKASLLGVYTNEVWYRVTGPDMAPVTGTSGPIATSSLGSSGSLDFNMTIPQGSQRLMSFQINDAATHQALALGAVVTDVTAGGVSDIGVTMGSLVSNCYSVDTSSLWATVGGAYYTFQTDTLSTVSAGSDLGVVTVGGGQFGLTAQGTNSIAYLGNGPLINFDTVPPPAAFTSSSVLAKTLAGVSPSYLQSNDVYCISLGAGGANGSVWLQVVNPNQPFGLIPPGPTGPKFSYRLNKTLSFFSFDQTSADQLSSCPAPPATPTDVPTNTFTPTNSPTNTNTFTPTLSPTNTPSFTPTLSPTNTLSPTDTFTRTLTFTPTNSPTITDTFTPTLSPTWTGTPTFSGTPTNSVTKTPSNTPSPTVTTTGTATPSSTRSSTATTTASKTPSGTPSGTPTVTPTSTLTLVPTATGTNSPTSTSSGTPSSTGTTTPTSTQSGTPTNTQTTTASGTPTFSPTDTPTPLPSSTPTNTATFTASFTVTSTATVSATQTPSGTPTNSQTTTASATPSFSPTNTTTPAASNTPTSTLTASPSNTPSPTPSLTATNSPSFSPTSSITATLTNSPTATPSATATNTATLTLTSTPTLTYTLTPLPTPQLGSAGISCIDGGTVTNTCRVFQLSIVANGAASFYSQSYALVKDLTNSTSVWVGPWSYSDGGTTFTTNLSGESFGVTSISTPAAAAFSVVLYDSSKSVSYGSLTPSGSVTALEAPPGYLYSTNVSAQTTLEDGNISVVYFSVSPYTPACAATQISMVRLTNSSNGASTLIGPVTYTCNGFNFFVPAENLGITVGQQALNQQFTTTLYDSTGTQVWDSKPAGSLNLEYPGNAIASSSINCITSDSGNGACQAFVLTINANGPPGVPSTSYGYVTGIINGVNDNIWVGPWTYTGNGTSYSVTLLAEDFATTTPGVPVSSSFLVRLYDAAQSKILDTSVPTGAPVSIEAPSEYIYNNAFSCLTTAVDGNCADFNFSTYLNNPSAGTVTSLVRLTDLTQPATIYLGPYVNTGGNQNFVATLNAANFGLAPGATAVNHAFQEDLTDASGMTVLDSSAAGTFSYEYPGNNLAGSAITCVYSDPVSGFCQGFQLTIDPDGPAGILSQSMAKVTDVQNNTYVWVGPITYMGTGDSYSVTLLGDDFSLSTGSSATLTGFNVKLYDATETKLWDQDTPLGSPITMEYPKEYIYSTSFSCNTTAEDGNCTYFTFNMNLDNPGSTPMTTLVKLTDSTSGQAVFLGPFVNNGGGNQGFNALLNGAEFNLNPGQTAVTHLFQAQIYDSSATTILDMESAGTFSYEYPSDWIGSSSITPYLTDPGNSAVQSFILTINANGPPGVPSTSYALVTDKQNSATTWVGPFTYSGTGSSYSVTLRGSDFSLTTNAAPVSTAFTVKLYDNAKSQLFDTSIPTGSPVSFEAPSEFIYGAGYNTFTCITTLGDGNCGYMTYNTDLDAPFGGTTPVTTLVKLIDQSALPLPVTLTLGPFVNNGGNRGYAVTLNAASFGLAPGQSAMNQVFLEKLYDASGVTLLDQTGTLNASFEYPSPYLLNSTSITPILTDAAHGGAMQTFLLTINSQGPAGTSTTSYANIIDNTNSNSVSVGPWTYNGVGSYSVTLKGSDFGLTSNAAPVSTAFSVRLYNQQNQWLDTFNPSGYPVSFEAPPIFIYGYNYNTFTCQTTAQDGNCIYMTYNTDLQAPFGAATPVTTVVKLENLTSGVTLILGPFVNNNANNTAHSVTLNAASFGLAPGQTAVNQQFQEQVYDYATTTTLYDQTATLPASYEYPTNYLNSAAISVLSTDPGNGAAQRFQLALTMSGPSGVSSTNYAYVTDLQNSGVTWVGPFTYTGTYASFAVTLKGSDFSLTTGAPVSTAFKVQLFDGTQSHWYDTITPTGSPITFEAPQAYLYGGAPYNTFPCTTSAEDGNCINFLSNVDIVAPYGSAGTPVTTYVKLENLSTPMTLTLGPYVNSNANNTAHSVTLTPGQFGLAPGQVAYNQAFQVQLLDSTQSILLDQEPAQTFSYEYPTNYLDSSAPTSITPLLFDSGTNAYQEFALTINPNGPPSVPSISYAYVMDINNGYNAWVGPITYVGTGLSYSVTLLPEDFNLTTASLPVSTAFTVRLYDETQTHWLDTSTPANSPVTLEAPLGYIYSNSFNQNVLAEDGNSVSWVFNTTLNTPGATSQSFLYSLVDLSIPSTLFFGPVANASGNHAYAVTVNGGTGANGFGLAAGQQGIGHQFEEFLYDSSGVTLLDYYTPPLTLNVENNSPTNTVTYNGSSVSPLITDASSNWQSFLFAVTFTGSSAVTSTTYARLGDLNNSATTLMGPFTFSGGPNNFSVTVKASDLNITASSAVSTAMAVTLYTGNASTTFATGVPTGSPATLIAPLQHFTSGSLASANTAEDGNWEAFTFSSGMNSPSGPTVVTDLQLVDTNASGGPITVEFGPVTDSGGGGNSASYTLYAQQFGLTSPGATALNQQFQELLYSVTGGVTLLDTRSVDTINLEFPSPYLASSSVGCAQAGPSGCQQYTLTLNPMGPAGVAKTSYAKVVDLNNGTNFFVGPFTFTGTGPSYSVTMNGWPLGITANNAVSNVSFAVTLYDATKTTAYNYSIPTGSPISIQSPIQYLSSGSLTCNTSAEDGYCETFTFNTGMNSPSGPTVVTYVRLVDTNASGGPITINEGPVTDSGGGGNSAAYSLAAQQFGLTTAGQQAASQVFVEYLYADAAAATLLDTRSVGILNLEAPSPILASASIGCVQTDPSGNCQQFALNLNAQGPVGAPKTSYAKVVDLNNGTSLFVGPWTYSGAGTTFSVTLTGQPFNVYTAGAVSNTSFAVTLFDATKTQQYNYVLPTGSPISLEAPIQYIYSNSFSCNTSNPDGNCEAFTFNTNIQSPSGPTVVTYIKLIDLTTGVTVSTGPVTDSNGGGLAPSFSYLPAQFGVTTPGQIAPNQNFLELLYADAGSVTLLDQKTLGPINLEAPSPYLASSSVSCLYVDPATLACRSIQLNLGFNGPAGVSKTVWAYVTDLSNSTHLWEGPFTFIGSGSTFAVTIRGNDFSLATANLPVSTAMSVTLYDSTKSHVLDSAVPAGSPLTMEAPLEYLNFNNPFSCTNLGADGNCQAFNFNPYVIAPGSATVTTQMVLTDLSNSLAVTINPIVDNNGGAYNPSYPMLPQQFGVTTAGQVAANQAFMMQLYDASGVTLLDTYFPGSLNLETPSPYLAGVTLASLVTDPGTLATESLQFLINANAPNGVTKTSTAWVLDKTTGTGQWVGPWTYTGSGTNYPVTLTSNSFGVTANAVLRAHNFAVTLFNPAENQPQGSMVPTGSPVTLESISQYLANDYFTVNTTGFDGYWQNFYLYNAIGAPNSGAVSSLIKVIDLSNSTTVVIGPVTTNGPGNSGYNFYLAPQQFAVTAAGQMAASQLFMEQLYDASGVTLFDTKYPGTLNIENSVPYLSSSAITCLTSDGGNGSCQAFQLTLNSNGPAGTPETSYAYVTDLTNGTQVLVGPWSYNGPGSFAVTLSAKELGLTTANLPVPSQLAVTLLNGAGNNPLGVSFPSGSPITLETPLAYINSTSVGVQTAAEDGNWNSFTFYLAPYTPACATTQTGQIHLIDTTNGASVTIGPVTFTCNNDSWVLTAAQLGLTPGQTALNQNLVAQLWDPTGTHIWDVRSVGTVNLESPSLYMASSSVSALTTDGVTGGVQAFQLTVNANGPAGVSQVAYAYVQDLTNGNHLWAGPWGFTGSGNSYSTTISGWDLGLTTPGTPVVSQFAVTLFNLAQNSIYSSAIPTGSPLNLEAPFGYIYSSSMSCPASLTAQDGNCKGFNYIINAYTPSCATTQTSMVRVLDTTNGGAVTLGPVTYTCNGFNFQFSANQFGLTPGQQAMGQVFRAELYNPAGTSVWDTYALGTFNLEGQ